MNKKLFLLLIVCSFSCIALCQNTFQLTENKTEEYNGLEYGFTILNEKNKAVKGEDYDRFEIELYVTNNSGCTKTFPFKYNSSGQLTENSYSLAEFSIRNATGKRLTAKSGKVEAVDMYSMVKVDQALLKNPDNNNGFIQAKTGYGIRNGQRITKRIIVIVPKGEKPDVNCNAAYVPEVN